MQARDNVIATWEAFEDMRLQWMTSSAVLVCLLAVASCSDEMRPEPHRDPLWTQTQEYREKSSGTTYVFTPIESEIGIKFSSNSTLDDKQALADRFGLTPEFKLSDVLRYDPFELPRGRSVERLGPKALGDAMVIGALPVYANQEGYPVYVDPEWIVIVFVDGVSQAAADSILATWGVTVDRAFPAWSTYSVKVPQEMSVFDAVRAYVDVSEVLIAEPYFYSYQSWP